MGSLQPFNTSTKIKVQIHNCITFMPIITVCNLPTRTIWSVETGPYLGRSFSGGFRVWPAMFELGGAGHTFTERLCETNRQGHQSWRLFKLHVHSGMQAHGHKHACTHAQKDTERDICMLVQIPTQGHWSWISIKIAEKWECCMHFVSQAIKSNLKLLFSNKSCSVW